MSDFDGFSQEEIHKVSGAKTKKSEIKQFRGQHVGLRRLPEKWSRPLESIKKPQVITNKPDAMPPVSDVATKVKTAPAVKKTVTIAATLPNNIDQNDTLDDVNLNRSMSKSIEEALFYQPMQAKAKSNTPTMTGNSLDKTGDKPAATNSWTDDSSILKLSAVTDTHSLDDSSILPAAKVIDLQCSDVAPLRNSLNVDSPFKGVSLKDFESHRKMIEEQNKQKKELLYKAIEHHSQKTAAETRKIEEIKSELAKLDNDLAVDVAILRKQIDNACINFANIEKQYIKIEAQFLKSKMDLHNAAEKKELLTEHLCTVIAHNEDRKAQKLSELMEKVGLTPSGGNDEYEAPTTNNIDK